MPAKSVDLVLVVDASQSMQPCFDGLRNHLADLLGPLQQAQYKVRFGLVAYAAAGSPRGPVYDHTFIGGSGVEMIRRLYDERCEPNDFFTKDPSVVVRALASLEAQGNENTPVALDIAADFPFGPLASTRRVIAVFTDEALERGVEEMTPLARLPDLLAKLYSRKVLLFVAARQSEALEALGTLDGCQIEPVSGGDGLQSLDFAKLFRQMGKSISISTMQSGLETAWSKALYGQDQWGKDQVVSPENRHVILAVGESTKLSTVDPIENVQVKLKWTAPVDLDLHAFFEVDQGEQGHVFFGCQKVGPIKLDWDAGIGDAAGDNEENISIGSFEGFRRIVFATKIFRKGGCYADYDGQIVVTTNNGDVVVVPLSSQETADWCVIASIVLDQGQPTITNVNRVTKELPSIDEF